MYKYMIFNDHQRKLYRDFLAYYKRNAYDDFYIVSVDNPKLAPYLVEFIERRLN